MKTLYLLIIILFLISCNNNTDKDIFSNRDINFKKLNLNNDISNKDRYDITDIKVKLIPLDGAVKLSEEDKNYIIENTEYGKDLYYIDSIFFDEKNNTFCLVAYMKDKNNSLEKLINYINSMENNNNILKNYFYINGNKNIQYKLKLEDTVLFFVIFEARNSNYLVLNYIFPVYYEYNSMKNIANSIDSVKFY